MCRVMIPGIGHDAEGLGGTTRRSGGGKTYLFLQEEGASASTTSVTRVPGFAGSTMSEAPMSTERSCIPAMLEGGETCGFLQGALLTALGLQVLLQ